MIINATVYIYINIKAMITEALKINTAHLGYKPSGRLNDLMPDYTNVILMSIWAMHGVF